MLVLSRGPLWAYRRTHLLELDGDHRGAQCGMRLARWDPGTRYVEADDPRLITCRKCRKLLPVPPDHARPCAGADDARG